MTIEEAVFKNIDSTWVTILSSQALRDRLNKYLAIQHYYNLGTIGVHDYSNEINTIQKILQDRKSNDNIVQNQQE